LQEAAALVMGLCRGRQGQFTRFTGKWVELW